MRRPWSTDEITLALALYLKTPHSKISSSNPDFEVLANLLGRTTGAVSLKLANLVACDPEAAQNGHKGFSHGSKLDKEVWQTYIGEDRTISLDALIQKCQEISEQKTWNVKSLIFGESITEGSSSSLESIDGTTDIQTLVKLRRGQNFFRQMVLCRFQNRCVITGINLPPLLEAAHIIPWSENPSLRLVPQNGLALSSTMHKAYDKNFLGIDGDGRIHISDLFLQKANNTRFEEILIRLNGKKIILPPDVKLNSDYLDLRYQKFRS